MSDLKNTRSRKDEMNLPKEGEIVTYLFVHDDKYFFLEDLTHPRRPFQREGNVTFVEKGLVASKNPPLDENGKTFQGSYMKILSPQVKAYIGLEYLKAITSDPVDPFSDVEEFTRKRNGCMKKHVSYDYKIDREFITRMVQDELNELNEAKDEAEEVDALLDAVYYILQHLSTLHYDIRPIWKMIHAANMKKFTGDGHLKDGKWIKPSDFVPPDSAIRLYVSELRQTISNLQNRLKDNEENERKNVHCVVTQ